MKERLSNIRIVRMWTDMVTLRGRSVRVVEHRTFRSKGPGFKTTYCCFEAWATSFTPLCLCLSEESVKAVSPFYLVSMPGEVKDLTLGNRKNLLWAHRAGALIL